MNVKNKKIKYTIYSIFITITIIITTRASYAYFKSKIFNAESTSTIVMTGGKMEIEYFGPGTDGNTGNIVASKIAPGWEAEKIFTLSGVNDTNLSLGVENNTMYYKVGVNVLSNTFSGGSFTYLLEQVNTPSNGQMISQTSGILPNSGIVWIGVGNFAKTETKVDHKYKLTVAYPDDGTDQSINNGKSMNAYVVVEGTSEPEEVTITIDLNGGHVANIVEPFTVKGYKNVEMSLDYPTKGETETVVRLETISGEAETSETNIIPQTNATVKVYYGTYFVKDSWETIAANVRDGNTSMYNVGDIKCVKIEGITPPIDAGCGDEEFAVRLVNKRAPSECNTEGFSQTACGFVLEFTSVIEKYNMNPAGEYKGTNYPRGWNVDGWPASSMYKYLNGIKNGTTWNRTDTLFSKLDSNLQNVIIDTYTVSGHGPTVGEQNFESYDKLYLLSTKEVWGNCGDGTNGTTNCYDTATNVTRQLDWYNADIESGRTQVTTSNSGSTLINTPIKYYQSAEWYWLRSANSINNYSFKYGYSDGYRYGYTATSTGGIAPAFRIG